ncbi:MAG: hypothetical protein KGJ23_08655 [Euryarchaeota archaeon]|nr:hypothetical protein [Euryarchaeota archaeon]
MSTALTTTDTEGTVTSEEVKEGRFEVWLSYDGEKVQKLARSDKLWVAFRHAYGYLPVYPHSTVLVVRDGDIFFRLDQGVADLEAGMWANGWHPFLKAFLKLKEEGKEEDRGGGPAGLKANATPHRTVRYATEAVLDAVLKRYKTKFLDIALGTAVKEHIGGIPWYGKRKFPKR